MPAIQRVEEDYIPQSTGKELPITTDTVGLQQIADRHITKGLGRLRDHVFKEGRGLEVLTTVCSFSLSPYPKLSFQSRWKKR